MRRAAVPAAARTSWILLLQARIGQVALEIGVPSPRDAGDGVQLDERADERLGIAGQRDCAEIAGGLVFLAIVQRGSRARSTRHTATRRRRAMQATGSVAAAAA